MQSTLKANPSTASSRVKPKIDTVRLEKLITQCLLTDVPLSIITESYDISYKQMGLLLNMTRGFERQTTKMDHTFDSFSYEAIPEDYFAIPHVLPEEKHYGHEKMMELFAELEIDDKNETEVLEFFGKYGEVLKDKNPSNES